MPFGAGTSTALVPRAASIVAAANTVLAMTVIFIARRGSLAHHRELAQPARPFMPFPRRVVSLCLV